MSYELNEIIINACKSKGIEPTADIVLEVREKLLKMAFFNEMKKSNLKERKGDEFYDSKL